MGLFVGSSVEGLDVGVLLGDKVGCSELGFLVGSEDTGAIVG